MATFGYDLPSRFGGDGELLARSVWSRCEC